MDAPPPYSEATSSSVPSNPPPNAPSNPSTTPHSNTLDVPYKTRNGIPPPDRRSMEDEARALPPGWLRQYDHTNAHQYFVDSNVDPPRSIWHHPYDDQQFLDSLPPQERQRVQTMHKIPSEADILAESSDDESGGHQSHLGVDVKTPHPNPVGGSSSPSSSSQPPPKGVGKFGRRMKDKLTNSTHEQREAARAQRAEAERQAYERHQMLRRAMSMAVQTGQPQPIGKDKDGKDMYIEPPQGAGPGGYGQGGYGYNPYTQGPYANPNARFLRPRYDYGRPYGGGYGGGYGLPLAGGLMGGLLIGDMMGGAMMGGGF